MSDNEDWAEQDSVSDASISEPADFDTDDDDDDESIFQKDEELLDGQIVCDKDSGHRFSPRIVSIFERTRIIGLRAMHLEHGAGPLIETSDTTDAYKIASEEYYSGRLGFFKIRRELQHRIEIFQLSEFSKL